jgi:hypothetical protein
MIDLEQAIHSYIEAAFESASANTTVSAHDVSDTTVDPHRGFGRRRIRNGVVAGGVALTIVVLAAALFVLRPGRDGKTVRPAHTAAAALVATGPADCTNVAGGDDTVLLAVAVTGHHTICITQRGSETFTFVDGTGGVSTTGLTPLGAGTWSAGGARTNDGHFFMIANLLNDASALRARFCDGTTLDLQPLNDANPRFVAATFDPAVVGNPSLQQLDASGHPFGATRDPSPPGPVGSCSAKKTGDTDASTIPPGQYRYVRVSGTRTATAFTPANEAYTVLLPTTYEFWIGADDSGRIRTSNGAPTFLTPENERIFNDAGLADGSTATLASPSDQSVGPGDMHSVDLSTFPTNAAALRDALSENAHTGPSDNAERLLQALGDNLWRTYGPTRNARFLLAALSSTPGMDVTRRDGMTILSADQGGVRKEIWFDTETGEIRRRRQVIVDATIPYKLHAPNGTVLQDEKLEDVGLVPSTESTP